MEAYFAEARRDLDGCTDLEESVCHALRRAYYNALPRKYQERINNIEEDFYYNGYCEM